MTCCKSLNVLIIIPTENCNIHCIIEWMTVLYYHISKGYEKRKLYSKYHTIPVSDIALHHKLHTYWKTYQTLTDIEIRIQQLLIFLQFCANWNVEWLLSFNKNVSLIDPIYFHLMFSSLIRLLISNQELIQLFKKKISRTINVKIFKMSNVYICWVLVRDWKVFWRGLFRHLTLNRVWCFTFPALM